MEDSHAGQGKIYKKVKNVASTMAIEDMYFSKDFIDKIVMVAEGKLSSGIKNTRVVVLYPESLKA